MSAKPSKTAYFLVRGVRYEWPEEYTGRELRLIKAETGYRMGEVEEGVRAGDIEVLLALAVIAMRRAGKEDTDVDDLVDLTIGDEKDGIDFREEDEDEEARPTEAAPTATPSASPSAAKPGRRRTPASTA